ncbi:MAG: response regulator [Verrucomicrobiales bacterium]|nr:response regulator [Verrucomicrobiales bacterium]
MTTKTHHFLPSQFYPKTNQYVVLVVDDMQVNRVLLSKVFTASGYGVAEADSAESAVEMIAGGLIKPDVIITDVEMPGMNGISLTSQIRSLPGQAGEIPIIVASGNPDADMEMDAYDAGADVFLTKPFNLAQLRDEVRDAIKGDNNIRVSVRRLHGKSDVNRLRTRLP